MLHRQDPRWKVLSFSRNFGHQAAVSAGLFYCQGDVVAIMDADLQDPPEELQRFLEKWREGYHVVYAIRTKRKEGLLKRVCYKLFYRLLRWLASIDIPVDAGDFCVMDRTVVEVLKAMPERTRFVRGLRSWSGFRQVGVAYERSLALCWRAEIHVRAPGALSRHWHSVVQQYPTETCRVGGGLPVRRFDAVNPGDDRLGPGRCAALRDAPS